jgi:hypothetical protein
MVQTPQAKRETKSRRAIRPWNHWLAAVSSIIMIAVVVLVVKSVQIVAVLGCVELA